MKSIQLIGHSHPVLISTIVWLEGDANYTHVHYQNGPHDTVTQPLQWFEHNTDFIRVHRSAIINPAYVTEFVQKRGRSGWVQLINGKRLAVSRNRLEQTAARLATLNQSDFPSTE
ncbi:LytR/AlgR family response regulator transcription factor [Spirosoma flavus]